jgi:hypothetical protein
MKKLVHESLFELYGQGWQSSSTDDVTMQSKPTPSGWMDPAEFENWVQDLVDQDLGIAEATKQLKAFFAENEYMHGELGEVEGADLYKSGIDIFINRYEDQF